MEPRIETLAEKKLVGMRAKMSLANNNTKGLWQKFMPRRKEVTNNRGTDLFSMQVYEPLFDFKDFNPHTEFDKWAAIEVTDFENIPNEMEPYTLTGGLYAVFIHKGPASSGPKTFGYIYGKWIPSSVYQLDNSRAHFEILGEKYKNEEPDSEEEVWIPIKSR